MTLSGPQPGLPKSWVSGINGFGSWWPGTPAVGLPITVPGTYTLTAYVYNAPSSAGLGWNSGSPTALAVYAAFCQEPKTTSPTGCFYFTINGVQVSQIDCNPKANDIKTDFTQLPGTVCNIQFTVNGVPDGKAVLCPTRANDVEVYWTLTPTGPAITKCTWTYDEKPIIGACPVPPRSSASGYANDFVVSSHAVVRVYWTINGNLITPPVTAPKGANDVDFFF